MITKRLYYEDVFLSQCKATVMDIKEKGIVLDQTVGFPEGGGQEGDKGEFLIPQENGDNIVVPFTDTQKGVGRLLYLDNFPTIHVDTPIFHSINSDQYDLFKVGQSVVLKIDIQRRATITVNHSAIHLALMAIEQKRPNISSRIKGAHISVDGARLDFSTEERFTPDEIDFYTSFICDLVDRDELISVFHHERELEAWYWKCVDSIFPCGGTHLPSARYIGHPQLRRKNLGKNLERISIACPNSILPIELFHDTSSMF